MRHGTRGTGRRLLVVSHPAVIEANQAIYAELVALDWDVRLVVPARWRHEYASGAFTAERSPELGDRVVGRPVVLAGKVQRHLYVPPLGAALRGWGPPAVAYLEEETFGLPAAQWGRWLARKGIPFGVQADENLDRRLHPIARRAQSQTLSRAAFVTARSPTAERLVRRQSSRPIVEVIPHAVPGWELRPHAPERPFTVGFAGRLIAEKGMAELLEAVRGLSGPARLLLVGNGAMRDVIQHADLGSDHTVEVRTTVRHHEMAAAYAEMDVLVLPSRTTPTWAEQFGRVLVEALWCGVPVIGSDSGEIPWVIETTGGGFVFREGDAHHLLERLEAMRTDPGLRRRFAEIGRRKVEEQFAVEAVARQMSDLLARVADGAPRAR